MSDLSNLQTFFRDISFNDDPKRRNKNTYLVQLDPFHIQPNNYAVKPLQQYKGILTWNSKIYHQLKGMGANVAKLPYFPFLDNDGKITEFLSYEEKEGICIIEPTQHISAHPFDITNKKLDMFMSLKHIKKHAYGSMAFAGNFYVGNVLSNSDKLQTINDHRFCVCFDDIYHPIWSWDYITNKIIDCFKSKTIPIYYGCYNIDEIIPSNLFIDFRDFSNVADLNEYLLEFNEDMYTRITENAYQWVQSSKLGDVNKFAEILQKYTQDKK